MIEFLSSWVKNLSLALIIVSILEIILPNSKTKKYVKMVMGLYILFSIIAPFIENENKFKFDDSIYKEYAEKTTSTYAEVNQTSMDNRLNEIYKEKLQKDITQRVEENGYRVENCKVTAYISDKESKIESITLKINRKKEIEKTDESENKIITEVQDVKKVEIEVDKNNNENEKEVTSENVKITKKDIENIKKILINEYGVSDECLKIS